MTYKRKDERHNTYRLRNPDPIDNTWHFKLNDIFPPDMLEYIIKSAEELPDSTQERDDIRQNQATWLPNDDSPMRDVYKHLEGVIRYANDAKFHFAIDEIEQLQHLSYNKEDKFEMHTDCMIRYAEGHNIRKISCSILLNEDYEGGEFHFASKQQNWEVGKIKKNCAVFFPSFMPHSVTPITKGNRQSLIVWARGPQFV